MTHFTACRNEPWSVEKGLNSLQNGKILDQSKLKECADDKINATEKLKFVLGRVDNIVGKGENAGIQHFLPLPHVSNRFTFQVVKSRDSVLKS